MRSLRTDQIRWTSVFITAANVGIIIYMIVLTGCMEPPPVVCGDNVCDKAKGETFATCPKDCPAGVCGNHLCDGAETLTSCPADCKSTFVCGDTSCNGSENADTCSSDCADECGDRYCSDSERMTVGACELDCPIIECGDGRCDLGESAVSCPRDCATVPN